MAKKNAPIPFEAFAGFERLAGGNPIIACDPPEWAAAAHAFVMDDAVHYLWGRRRKDNYWVLMHSIAPAINPARVAHDPRNPVLLPSSEGFDDYTTEYPFPFYNPADRRYYVYYLGRRLKPPKQTGLLVGDGDFGMWTRVCHAPVIAANTEHERLGSSHPSVAVSRRDHTHHLYGRVSGATDDMLCDRTDERSRNRHQRPRQSDLQRQRASVGQLGRPRGGNFHGAAVFPYFLRWERWRDLANRTCADARFPHL